MFDFEGRVVIVAGAAGNLGQAVAKAFWSASATIVLLDHAPDRLPPLFPDLAESPKHLLLGSVDAMNVQSVEQAVQKTLQDYGRIDVLVNTIGGYQGGILVDETPVDTWEYMMALNAKTAFILSQSVVRQMLEQASGKIIHVAARAALAGTRRNSAYSASKAALVRLVESMAAEYRHKGINVNCVLPGTIDTPQNRQEMPNAHHDRWVPPEAIADVILFLASDAAWAVNGAAVPVYGRS
jgi:NAD(P)-dependent dehydrogenase (short-subunit alcohol dehydrogenase family)